MKKVLCITLCILTLLAAWSIGPDVSAVPSTLHADAAEADPINAAESTGDFIDSGDAVVTGIVGDTDRDGTVSILDATRIQRCLAGLYIDEGGLVAAFGDVDGDGLSITDATAIQRYIAGIPTDHPLGQYIIVTVIDEEPTQPATRPAAEPPSDPGSVYKLNDYELKVVELVNGIRRENGLKELSIDTELCRIARMKAQDMHDNDYFDHISPTYGSPFDMMDAFGISYNYAGENIAMGYATPQAVVNGWMNSEGHRRNILTGSFTKIGMGYVADGNIWTQMFIG